MKIGIIGVGALGGYYGAKLALAGNAVHDCPPGKKMTWEELQAVKNHQHYDSYYEA